MVRRGPFELEFSELRRAQIDPLRRARRVDLRAHRAAVAAALRRRIGQLYLATRQVAGLVGAVRCHAGQWILMPEPTEPDGITL